MRVREWSKKRVRGKKVVRDEEGVGLEYVGMGRGTKFLIRSRPRSYGARLVRLF